MSLHIVPPMTKAVVGLKNNSAPPSASTSRRQSHAIGDKKYSVSMHALEARRRSVPPDSAWDTRRKSASKSMGFTLLTSKVFKEMN